MKQLLLSTFISNIELPNPKNFEEISEKIKKQKINVLENKIPKKEVDSVRPEIVQSWLRSKKCGLSYQIYNYPPVLDKKQFKQLLNEKDFFIKTTEKAITELEGILFNAGILLTDEKGVILKLSSELETHNNLTMLAPGSIWNEETIGTCAHGMCILFKRPIQLYGPEHYCGIFDSFSCSAAPIFNSEGNLEGTITISSPYIYNQSSHTLGLVTMLASIIQKEFQVSRKEELLNIALSQVNDAILVINKLGIISEINQNAEEMFKSIDTNLVGTSIYEILNDKLLINTVLETGKPIVNKNIEIRKLNKSFSCSIQLVKNNDNKFGYVVNLRPADYQEKKRQKTCGLSATYTFDRIIGDSKKLTQTKKMAKKFAHFNLNILLLGETGTGKELFAQAIHNEGRPDGPYVAINCAAIPSNLIESELFGYEAGSFTGAERGGKPGKIELANGGTLFLDEIGDMPLNLQAVLLRVLEDGKVMRLGGSEYIPVDFRLIAATNKNLLELAKNEQFREDLYYRIAAFQIKIPSLIHREADIFQLIDNFINFYSTTHAMKRPTLSKEAKYALLNYNWPGNVRQLKNTIFYAMCMSIDMETDPVILPEHLPEDILDYVNIPLIANDMLENELLPLSNDIELQDDKLTVKNIEENLIKKVLSDTNRVEDAAKVLGISKSTLYRKLKTYGLKEKRYDF
ncbi:Acetoin dehydrogenase operon transcriptional activator AcoR [Sporomusa silvacetica DSM 10669]|uniref:Acetoin dehydrogenase operon transcriptional activator AcoR n=1 Tax=Sporomusa silvacetica DSM 10669 TaxID=1123289 RepID=A0ABZ3IHD9_9FIRM|nr:sigma 54-interacting transcriptional regulator [Sporomusa silvacetica]OZC13087.1 acetoin dehydrogenase operon transcriptional activator AcoR [Sporomusa silvacetica DSM 10669]